MPDPASDPGQARPLHPHRTPLAELVESLRHTTPLESVGGDVDGVVVSGISLSSARTVSGDVYAALPGARTHGIVHVGDALAGGAVAVLTDVDGAARVQASGDSGSVPILVVDDPRGVLGRLSAEIFGEPATAMAMIGVTGTQGKTTTTRLLEGGLQGSGTRAAVIGTVGTRIDGSEVRTSLTTPEAPDLHGLYARMREQQVAVCVMEVSSHALVLGRVDGVLFDCAVFLNLGRDHLDFHTGVEDYYLAKASLFTPERARRALVNIDDEHGRRLVAELRRPGAAALAVTTFSVAGRSGADWTVADLELAADHSTFTLVGPDGLRLPAGCPLPGPFNVDNTVAAVVAAVLVGLDPGPVASAIASGPGVPGRFERVDAGQDFVVVVDYAHKPDAVRAALDALRPLVGEPDGRLLLVLGAGGDRDRGKRPLMGEIGGQLADLFVVTDDNPRTEDPAAVRAEVAAGALRGGRAEVVEVADRRAALALALGRARSGDIVLVAGKGHESGQEVAGVVHPFDDRLVVAEELARMSDP